jgi:hypothetical protein
MFGQKKKKKKQMTTNNNLTTIRLHVPHHVEEENRTFSETADNQICYRMMSHVPSKWCRCHPLASSFGTRANRFLKIFLKKIHEKYQNTL